MVIFPSTTSSFPFSSSSVFSSRLRISRARLFNKIPSSVSEIFFPLRINNVTPSSSSNAAICLDSVGWVICNCSAAFVKLCSFATVRKYRNSLNSIFIYTSFMRKNNIFSRIGLIIIPPNFDFSVSKTKSCCILY